MTFLGCSVCSGDFVLSADGSPLYCPVCDAPTVEQMEQACREGAEGIPTHIGVTTMVTQYKRCQDGSATLAWSIWGYERDTSLALDMIIDGLCAERDRRRRG